MKPGTTTPACAGTSRDRTWEYRNFMSTVLLSDADVKLLNALRPRCAVCDKPVDAFAWTGRSDIAGLIFSAACHGAVENVVLGLADVEALLRGGVQGGVAFAQPRLENTSHE